MMTPTSQNRSITR